MRRAIALGLLLVAPLAVAPPAEAASLQDMLAQTVLTVPDRASVMSQLTTVDVAATAALARNAADADALLTRAMVTAYRAKLTRDRRGAIAARTAFEGLAARYPGDPEVQLALGGWHLDAVTTLGGMVARAALGARKVDGLAASDRAIALGGDRALFTGLAALLRLALDPNDPRGRQLAEAATRGSTPTTLDRTIQRRVIELAAVIRGGNPRLVQALARRLLPLGQVKD